ncbi:MAG TPA: hypothetical protein ENH62_05220 [Marinobacter sp.]|nr:hypothetical protein [Marinobacter sp.]
MNNRDQRIGGFLREATDSRNVDFFGSYIESRKGRRRYNTARNGDGLDIVSFHFFRDENGVGYLFKVAGDKIFKADSLLPNGTWTLKKDGLTVSDARMTSVPFYEGTEIMLCLTNGSDPPLKYSHVTDAISELSTDSNVPKGALCFVLAQRLFIGPMAAANEDLTFNHSDFLDAISGTAWSDGNNFIQVESRGVAKAAVTIGDSAYILTEDEIHAVPTTGDAVSPFRVVQVANVGTLSQESVKVIPGEGYFCFLGRDGMPYSFDVQNRLVPIGSKIPAVLLGSDDSDYSGLNKNKFDGAVAVHDSELGRYRLYVPNAGSSYNNLVLDYYYRVRLFDLDPTTKTGTGHLLGQWFFSDCDVRAVVEALDGNNDRVIYTSSGKSDETTGTVAIDSDGNVTGTDTVFDQSMVGDDFIISAGTWVVSQVDTGTALVLTSYDGGTQSAGTSYTISRRGLAYQEDYGTNDDGKAIDAKYWTRWFDFGMMGENKFVPEANVLTRKSGAWDLDVYHMVDFEDGEGLRNLIDLTPVGAVVGTAIIGTAVIGSEGAVPLIVPTNTYGQAVRYRIGNGNLDQTFAFYGIIPKFLPAIF